MKGRNMHDRRIEVYEDDAGQWRWRLVSARGNLPDEILADSGEGYASKGNARRAAKAVHPGVEVLHLPSPEDAA